MHRAEKVRFVFLYQASLFWLAVPKTTKDEKKAQTVPACLAESKRTHPLGEGGPVPVRAASLSTTCLFFESNRFLRAIPVWRHILPPNSIAEGGSKILNYACTISFNSFIFLCLSIHPDASVCRSYIATREVEMSSFVTIRTGNGFYNRPASRVSIIASFFFVSYYLCLRFIVMLI
uniref:Secreted protein n=1 Tax=Anopheles culicifacies TaxID=139723 RepID=A0A182LSF7_9DIPT